MESNDPCRAAGAGLHVLTLPGWQGSAPAHWQSRWEALYGDRRVEQNDWIWPLRGDWMMRLEETIDEIVDTAQRDSRPAPTIALVAHSLGSQLVAAWAAHSTKTHHVHAAFLVAPPDIERADTPPQLHSFSPIVRTRLPFRALVVISEDDPFCSPDRARDFAADWGARTLAVGNRGHLNADSGLGDWPAGRALLAKLLRG